MVSSWFRGRGSADALTRRSRVYIRAVVCAGAWQSRRDGRVWWLNGLALAHRQSQEATIVVIRDVVDSDRGGQR